MRIRRGFAYAVASVLAGLTSSLHAQPVAISQIYGGGGNSGATWRQDFIELHNNANVPIAVDGWTVQYASAAGTTWQMTVLSGVIPPGGYYLVREAQGAGGTMDIPPPQAIGTIAMSATAGKVALVSNSVLLTGACPAGTQIVDIVGFGAANCFEGAGPTAVLSNTAAAIRNANGCQDTNNNATDFMVGPPNPRNAAVVPFVCGPSLLNRAQATSVLLSPSSGVPIDLVFATVWSPFVDAGAGPGFEGLFPPETQVNPPAGSGELGMSVTTPSYVFWIDDLPTSAFGHPCRFVLLDATQPNPTVSNGGIRVEPIEWWPVITTPGGVETDYFRRLIDVATNSPAGPANPQGLVGGNATNPADIVPNQGPAAAAGDASRHGIILIGDDREDFQGDIPLHERDLKNRSNVHMDNVQVHGRGTALDKNGFCMAIDNHVMALMTAAMNGMPPSRIYVRISTHGTNPNGARGAGITVKNGQEHITAAELCDKLRKYAKFGVPVHIVINACYSSALLDASTWNLPAGSTVVASAANNRSSYGGACRDGADNFAASCLQYALTKCGMDARANTNGDTEVDDCEAFAWVLSQKPCYTWPPNGKMLYPGGRPEGATEDYPDPNPSKRVVGVSGKSMNYNARNGTGADKTDFHIIFKGDVQGGTGRSWRSNANDTISGAWDFNPMITYDPTTDTTMVCYENTGDPAANGAYVHFGYSGASKPLTVVRQWWTPTGDPPAHADKAPAAGTSVLPGMNGEQGTVRIVNRSVGVEGWGEPILVQPRYWLAPVEIELLELNLTSLNSAFGPPITLAPPTLLPDNGLMDIPIPFEFPPAGMHLILFTQTSWNLNSTIVSQLDQFDPVQITPVCVADVDDGSFTGTPDGGVTIDDLLYYLFIFEAGDISADLDDGSFTGTLDGGVTIDDLLYYLFRFEAGC